MFLERVIESSVRNRLVVLLLTVHLHWVASGPFAKHRSRRCQIFPTCRSSYRPNTVNRRHASSRIKSRTHWPPRC